MRLRGVFRMPQGTFSWCCAPIHLVDVETCPKCGGAVKTIACIDDDEVIEKVLAHINAQVLQPEAAVLPPSRAPPQLEVGDDWL